MCLRYMFSPECYPKSCEEIIVIVKVCGEVIRCRRSAAERLAVPDFLDITQTAGDTAVAVGIEGVEVDRNLRVAAGIHLRSVEDRLNGAVNDLRSGGTVGVDKITVCIRLIVALGVTVTEG